LFGVHTDDAAVDEASKFPTVPAGRYESRIDTRQTFDKGTDPNFKETFDRPYARVAFPAFKLVNGEKKKIGRLQFNISWVEKRTARGYQDRAYQLFNQIKGALGMKGKSVGEVLTAMTEYPFIFNVSEQYAVPDADGKKVYKDVTEENRKFVVENQYSIYNNVNGISKVKAA
jgi:hypothetical protein